MANFESCQRNESWSLNLDCLSDGCSKKVKAKLETIWLLIPFTVHLSASLSLSGVSFQYRWLQPVVFTSDDIIGQRHVGLPWDISLVNSHAPWQTGKCYNGNGWLWEDDKGHKCHSLAWMMLTLSPYFTVMASCNVGPCLVYYVLRQNEAGNGIITKDFLNIKSI